MNYFVGIDLADRKHDVCILDSSDVAPQCAFDGRTRC